MLVTGLFRSRTPASPHLSSYPHPYHAIGALLCYCDATRSPNLVFIIWSKNYLQSFSSFHSLRHSQLKVAHMLPNDTSGPGSGRQVVPNKRRHPPPQQDPRGLHFQAKRAQVVAACQNCRLKKRKVGYLIRAMDQNAWILTHVTTV